MLHGLQIESPAPAVALPAATETAREALAYRVPMYRLLSGVFLEEPGAEFVAALRTPDSLAALAEAGLAFDADFLQTDTATLVDQLAVEYATLFTATGGFPPIESVRLTGRLKQDPFFAAADAYHRHGFQVGSHRFMIFDDQLGAELAFVGELLARCRHALDEGDEAGCRKLEREVKRFWTMHLGRWVRGYARLVQHATEHSLYREMARLLEAFAEDEIALLGLRIADEDQARTVVPKSEIQVAFNPDEPVCGACPSGPKSALAQLGEQHAG